MCWVPVRCFNLLGRTIGLGLASFKIRTYRGSKLSRDRLDAIPIGIRPEAIFEHRWHRRSPEPDREHLPLSLSFYLIPWVPARESSRLTIRLDRVRRHDGDQEVSVPDLTRDLLDQGVTDVQDDLVVADVEALCPERLDERQHKLLILVGVADEGGGHKKSLRAVTSLGSTLARDSECLFEMGS